MNNLIRLVVLSCILGVLAGQMQPAPQSTSLSQKSTYLVVYRPGPAWIPNKPLKEQPLKEHFQYMLGLYKKGVLKFAGPFADDSGGAATFEAANEEEAKAIVAADPAVTSHVFLPKLHAWTWLHWEKYLQGAIQHDQPQGKN